MGVLLYDIIVLISYFLIMIACCVVAIIFAKRLFSWFIFLPGSFIQLLALVGTRKQLIEEYTYTTFASYNSEAVSEAMLPYWITYIFLFVGTFITITIIYRHNSVIYRGNRKNRYAVVCEKCGNEFNRNEARCPKCGNKNIYG